MAQELSYDQAIDALRKLPEDKQRAVLLKLTPDERKGILIKLTSGATADFTTNTVDPKTGQGYGTYRMLPTSLGQQGVTDASKEIKVPYNRVQDAITAGYDFHPDDKAVYEKDSTHEGQGPTFAEKTKSFFGAATAPIPDTPITPFDPKHPISSVWQGLNDAALNVEKMPVNTVNATARAGVGLAGMPAQVVETIYLIGKGDNQGMENLIDMTPPGIGKSLWESYQNDANTLGPTAALSNLTGNLTAMYAAGKITTEAIGKAKSVLPERKVVPYEDSPKTSSSVWSLAKNAENEVHGVSPPIRSIVADHIRERVPFTVVRNLVEKTTQENEDRASRHSDVIQDALEETAQREREYDQNEIAAQVKAKEKLDTDNEKEREKVNADNLKKYEEYGQEEEKAAKERHDAVQKVAAIRAKNQLATETERNRQALESQHRSASAELAKKFKDASTKARNYYNDAWKLWRDKVKSVMAPMQTVVDAIKEQEQTLSPEQVSIFRDILRETKPGADDMDELQKLQQDIAQNNMGKNYADLNDAGKAAVNKMIDRLDIGSASSSSSGTGTGGLKDVPASRLHTWKSQLEVAVRKTKGPLKHSIGQVLQSVRSLEEQVSTQAGAGTELLHARAISGPYYDAFFGAEQELPPAARKSLRQQVPEHVKETEAQAMLDRIAAYDPSITKTAQNVNDLADRLDKIAKLQRKLPHPDNLTPLPPKPKFSNPKQPPARSFSPGTTPNQELVERPDRVQLPNRPETVKAGIEEARKVREDAVRKASDWVRKRGAWITTSAVIGSSAIYNIVRGDISHSGLEVVVAGTVYYGTGLLADFLDRENVAKWLAEPPQRDIDTLMKLPEDQRNEVISKFEPVVKEAETKGLKISPSITKWLAIGAASQTEKKKQITDSTSAPGPQSSVSKSPKDLLTEAATLQDSFHRGGFSQHPSQGQTGSQAQAKPYSHVFNPTTGEIEAA